MKKGIKKTLVLILSLAMMFTMTAMPVYADDVIPAEADEVIADTPETEAEVSEAPADVNETENGTDEVIADLPETEPEETVSDTVESEPAVGEEVIAETETETEVNEEPAAETVQEEEPKVGLMNSEPTRGDGDSSTALEQVLAAIGELSNDPRDFTAADKDSVEAINADYEALSADDQATVDNTFDHPSGDGQSYGRILEAALWAVRSYGTDTSTTLSPGTYTTTTEPAVSSESDKGKSDSSRTRNWWVESVVVEDGQATAYIYVTSGAATASKLTSYPSVWVGGDTIERNSDNNYPIPVDLNGTTYFGGISSSMPRPIMYKLTTTIEEPAAPQPSEDIELAITNNTGMFKAVTAYLTTEDGQDYLVMSLSGSGYTELFKGTYEQAVTNGDGTATNGNDSWIHGYTNADGKLEFKIPVAENDTYMPLVSVSKSYYDKYISGQNSLARAFYPRQVTLDREAKTLVTDDYKTSKEITVTNNVSMFSPGATATLDCVGGPNSNGYKADLILPMGSTSMSEVFVGSYAEAAEATSTIAFNSETNTFTIPVKWVKTFGQPETLVNLANGEAFYMSFKSKKNGSWYERKATLDEATGTLVFDPSAANYTAVTAAQEAAAAIERDNYTAESLAALDAALEAVVTGKFESQQSEVDAMAKAINDAIEGLVEKTPEPQTIDLAITNNTGMFKAVTAYLTTEDGQDYLVMSLSGSGYTELFKGTYEQAVTNGDGTATNGNDSWIHGYTNADGKLEFKIPVAENDTYMPLVSVSKSYYDKYISGQNSLARAFYPRQVTLDREAKTLVTDDYKTSKEITVTNNVSMFSPGATATLDCVGGPNSNGYKADLILPMGSTSMSEVFVGSYAEAAEATSTIAFNSETNTFTIPVKWVKTFGQPETLVNLANGEAFYMSFKSKKNGSWYERKATLDEATGTLVFDPSAADYTAVTAAQEAAAAIERDNYTAESLAALDAALEAVVTGKFESQQSEVDAMAQAINDAIEGLVEKTPEPQTIDLAITNNTGMFKAVTAYLTTEEGQDYLVMSLSGSGYTELFKGTYEQAVTNGDGTATNGNDSWIHGYTNADGKLEFKIPVAEDDTYMPLVSVSKSYYDKYISGQNGLARAFYPRQVTLDREAKTLVTDDYKTSKEITVTNNVSMFSPGATATLDCVGGPNSNGYKADLILPMGSTSMSEVFVGSYAEAAEATSTIAFNSETNTFTIPVKWVKTFGQPETLVNLANGEAFYMSFKSKKNGSWYERKATLDEATGTLVFDPSAANYTAVTAAQEAAAAIERDNYTAESLAALDAALEAVVTGKFESQQSEVDAMAQAINDAIEALELKPADYTAVDAAIAAVPADLTIYTDETAAAVTAAINAVDRLKMATEQADVDAMAAAINTAVAALKEKTDISGATIDEIPAQTYSGKALTPDVTVKLGEETLIKDTDYTVSFKNNTNVGTANVTVTGKGNYGGTVTATFKINAKKITPKVTLSKTSFTYNGKSQKPTVTVYDGSTKLAAANYTAAITAGTNVGTYNVKVTLKGNYSGTKTVTYKITAKKITPKVTLSKTSFTYNGKSQKPTVTVYDGSTKLAAANYTAAITAGTNVGTYNVKVTLKGNYSGTKTVTYKITAKKITPKVTLSKTSFTFNGKSQKPTVTVYDGSTKLAAANYTAAITAGTNVGTYNVKVTLKGNYSGTKTVTYKINPKGATIKAPAKAKKAFTAKWAAQKTKMSKAYVTGYQVQYATDKAFTKNVKSVNVKGYKKTSRKISGLKAKTTYYVRVRTYMTVSSKTYYSTWSAIKSVKTK